MKRKVFWYSLSISGIYSVTGLVFPMLLMDIQAKSRCCENVHFPFFLYDFFPLLLLLSCPGPQCVLLCRTSCSDALKEWAARSWESCTVCREFLGLHEITDLPAPFIASTDHRQQNCYFNKTQIIHIGDGLEQDVLHYHESKYVCVSVHTKWCPGTRYSTLSWV